MTLIDSGNSLDSRNRRKLIPGLIVLFGSGEMSPTGRRIHETVFKQSGFRAPVRAGILETPTGFEVNAIHSWPQRMEGFFLKHLKNYKPVISRIRAWRKDGQYSTNDPAIVDAILDQDYLYCGAGSPGYTIRHLGGSRAWEKLKEAHRQGAVLCLGSATALAAGKWAIPVYEIYKAGAELHWLSGLDFFSVWGLELAIVPHWNNREGEDFDTTRCWMGKERFDKLTTLLPKTATILGIEEQTACVLEPAAQTGEVLGVGSIYVIKQGKTKRFSRAARFSFRDL